MINSIKSSDIKSEVLTSLKCFLAIVLTLIISIALSNKSEAKVTKYFSYDYLAVIDDEERFVIVCDDLKEWEGFEKRDNDKRVFMSPNGNKIVYECLSLKNVSSDIKNLAKNFNPENEEQVKKIASSVNVNFDVPFTYPIEITADTGEKVRWFGGYGEKYSIGILPYLDNLFVIHVYNENGVPAGLEYNSNAPMEDKKWLLDLMDDLYLAAFDFYCIPQTITEWKEYYEGTVALTDLYKTEYDEKSETYIITDINGYEYNYNDEYGYDNYYDDYYDGVSVLELPSFFLGFYEYAYERGMQYANFDENGDLLVDNLPLTNEEKEIIKEDFKGYGKYALTRNYATLALGIGLSDDEWASNYLMALNIAIAIILFIILLFLYIVLQGVIDGFTSSLGKLFLVLISICYGVVLGVKLIYSVPMTLIIILTIVLMLKASLVKDKTKAKKPCCDDLEALDNDDVFVSTKNRWS